MTTKMPSQILLNMFEVLNNLESIYGINLKDGQEKMLKYIYKYICILTRYLRTRK